MDLKKVLRLKEVLKEKNVTGKELAEMLNLTETSVSRILNGTQYPKLETLLNISEALQVDIKDLFNSTKNTKALYIKDNEGNLVEVGQIKNEVLE